MRAAVWCALVVVSLKTADCWSAEDSLNAEALKVFTARCAECHGQVNPTEGLNVLNHRLLVAERSPARYVVAGDLDASLVWKRVGVERDMPPDEPLPEEETNALRAWIIEGARPWQSVADGGRAFLSADQAFTSVHGDLQRARDVDRPYLRYFSLVHLHNNPLVSEADLRKYRWALTKLLNSLSWHHDLVRPESIHESATILRIDLRDLEWDPLRMWSTIVARYPYGLSYAVHADRRLQQAAEEVYHWTHTEIPVVRADWFVANSSQPPLYHELLELPTTRRELEARLKVDVERDFQHDRLKRAGLLKSNVAHHNRIIDRHTAVYGAYWISYDFATSANRADIRRFPLGPANVARDFRAHAFDSQGNEIIFSLPNGLQGYFLTDGKGARIDKAPVEVVEDKTKATGQSTVLNGISCMVCHRQGINRFEEQLRAYTALTDLAKTKVLELFAPQAVISKLIAKDNQRFQEALDELGLPVDAAAQDQVPRGDLVEPVGAVSRQYYRDLTMTDVLAELGDRRLDAAAIGTLSSVSDSFGRFGLQPVVAGAGLKRETWEAVGPFHRGSLFQEIAAELKLGAIVSEREVRPGK